MKRIKLVIIALLITFYALPSFAREPAGTIVEDKAPYPFYQHSQLQTDNNTTILQLKSGIENSQATLVTILNKLEIPYDAAADSSDSIQTEWISWHYDAESKKAQSRPDNHFFSLNKYDKYRFSISVNNNQVTFTEVKRRHQVDVTPDTEMVWLKWLDTEPDPKAVKAFMQRLQTEYEILAIAAGSTPVPAAIPEQTTNPVTIAAKPRSNFIALNMGVNQAWGLLIKQLTLKSIPLATTHNDQRMINTDWISAKYDSGKAALDTSDKVSERHKFQLIVIPGASEKSSSIFVYHTASQQNSGSDSWSDSKTREEVAGALLDLLAIDQ